MQKTPENKAEKIGRAIPYYRVSTDDQSLGLDAQDHACRAAAAKLGLEMVDPIVDDGVCGATPIHKRPGLVRALSEIGNDDVFLVAKRDRLARDPMIVAMIEMAVRKKGGKVVSASGEGTEDDSPSSILMRRVIDAFAEFERLMIKARTKASIASLRRQGRVCGSPRFGERAIDDGIYSKKSRESREYRPSKLESDPSERETIELMKWLSKEGLSARKIAASLNDADRPTKRGGPWHHASVVKILARVKETDHDSQL